MPSRYYYDEADDLPLPRRPAPPPPPRRHPRRQPHAHPDIRIGTDPDIRLATTTTTTAADVPHPDAERIYDYIARHLVPAMLAARPERPLQLVLNLGGGALQLGSRWEGLAATAAAAREDVAANMPGWDRDRDWDWGRGLSAGARPPGRRRVGYCRGCQRRQLVGLEGYCPDCDPGIGERGGGGSGGVWLDGVRHVSTREPWVRREARDPRTGRGRYSGYWSDSEAGGAGYASGAW